MEGTDDPCPNWIGMDWGLDQPSPPSSLAEAPLVTADEPELFDALRKPF